MYRANCRLRYRVTAGIVRLAGGKRGSPSIHAADSQPPLDGSFRGAMVSTSRRVQCPQCGHQLSSDLNFVAWCEKCDWNVDGGSAPQVDRKTQRRQLAAKNKGQRLYESLRGDHVD